MIRKLIFVMVVLLIGLLLRWWVTHYDYVVKHEDMGFDVPAIRNRFLAAFDFLQALGLEVEVQNFFESVDEFASAEVILLAQEDARLSEEEVQKLLLWVEAGGHLIVGASKQGGGLAKALGYKTMRHEVRSHQEAMTFDEDSFDSDLSSDSETSPSLSETLHRENELYRQRWQERKEQDDREDRDLSWRQHVKPWFEDYNEVDLEKLTVYRFAQRQNASYVDYDSDYSLVLKQTNTEKPYQVLSSVRAPSGHLVHLTYSAGRGQIDVLINTGIWHNDRIGKLDHAHVLRSLIFRVGQTEKISIVTALRLPDVMELMIRWAPEFLISTIFLLVGWLIARGCRIGPIRSELFEKRRSLRAHVSACGIFLWRSGGHSCLLNDLRQPVLRRAAFLLGGGFVPERPEDWRRFIALVSGLDPTLSNEHSVGLIKRVLRLKDKHVFSEQEFLETVKVLQQLGKIL